MTIGISFPALPSDGQVLSRSNLTGMQDAITGYSITPEDMTKAYCSFALPFVVPAALSAAAKVFKVTVPSTEIWIPTLFEVSATTVAAGGTMTLAVTVGGSTVPTSSPVANASGTISSTSTFSITTIAPASVITVTLTAATNTITDTTAVLHFKTKLRA